MGWRRPLLRLSVAAATAPGGGHAGGGAEAGDEGVDAGGVAGLFGRRWEALLGGSAESEAGRGIEAVVVAGEDAVDGGGRQVEAGRGEVAAEAVVAETGLVP